LLNVNQYWKKIGFQEHDLKLGGDNYLEISSIDDTSFEAIRGHQKEQLATNFDEPPNYDFINQTIDQVYDFYKRYLRPADHSPDFPHFSAFTFAVVDAECLRSDPQQLLICSDAPDFNETDDAIVLKQTRFKATMAWGASVRMEELTMTPTEAELRAKEPKDRNFTTLKMQPAPPKLVRADESSGDESGMRRVCCMCLRSRRRRGRRSELGLRRLRLRGGCLAGAGQMEREGRA